MGTRIRHFLRNSRESRGRFNSPRLQQLFGTAERTRAADARLTGHFGGGRFESIEVPRGASDEGEQNGSATKSPHYPRARQRKVTFSCRSRMERENQR